MIYRSLRKNTTGQQLIGCPHVSPMCSVEMSAVPGGTIFEWTGIGHWIFMPSKTTIVIWCPDCYSALQDMERPRGHLRESVSH